MTLLAHLLVFSLGLSGFLGIALASPRYAPQLVGTLPPARLRGLGRFGGWGLLLAAAMVAMAGLGSVGVGLVAWLGWLTLAGLLLVFVLPLLPHQQRSARPPRSQTQRPDSGVARGQRPWLRTAIGCVGLALTCVAFSATLATRESAPLNRSDARRGTVGRWDFVLAESDRDPPELVAMDVPVKAYTIRFCETCDAGIRQAYFKVNEPHDLRSAGMAFEGQGGEREVSIQLPDTLGRQSRLWLTVVGKDGSVQQASWPIEELSPATLTWFEQHARQS